MKKTKILVSSVLLLLVVTFAGFSRNADKLISSKAHIQVYSHTSFEDIKANNYTLVSVIKPNTGEVIFSVPMQGFEFEKALMQKHFNSPKFLDTKKFPKAKWKGKITNLQAIDFTKDGTYNAIVEGDLTIKGVTNHMKGNGTVVVKGKTVEVQTTFNLILADYGIKFTKGKPSTNIAKQVKVTVKSEYTPE